MPSPIFERHAAAVILADLLVGCEEGAVVTFEEMNRATNRDVRGSDRHLLASARKAAAERGAVFGAIVRVGVRRMHPRELAAAGSHAIKRIGRAAKRGGRLLDSGDQARLTSEERLQHSATRGVLAAIESSAKRPTPQAQSASRDPVVRIA